MNTRPASDTDPDDPIVAAQEYVDSTQPNVSGGLSDLVGVVEGIDLARALHGEVVVTARLHVDRDALVALAKLHGEPYSPDPTVWRPLLIVASLRSPVVARSASAATLLDSGSQNAG